MERSILIVVMLILVSVWAVNADTGATRPHGHYQVLSATPRTAPPFDAVDFSYGPTETVNGMKCLWWQIQISGNGDSSFAARALTSGDPLTASDKPLVFKEYIINVTETGETLSYRNVHTGDALLPGWKDFDKYFIPHREKGSREESGMPNTLELLGHTLMLQQASMSGWPEWKDVKTLDLDPELLIGTSRNFKDTEGKRLPAGSDYTYKPFTKDDYRLMIDVGFNIFRVDPSQEQYVTSEPVFFLRGVKGDRPLRYPADLYRSNYMGSVMYMDEPTSILTGDANINRTLRNFSDFASVIKKRVHAGYNSNGNYGSYELENELKKSGVNLGDMRLMQYDYPSWETVLETAYYQMEGGCNGFVHEGRYKLTDFQRDMDRWTGVTRTYTPEEYLKYSYALLRGGTRPFGKYWGTSIYGQSDPKLSPLAVNLAYDMGARYIWFWTSDHDHHLPWNEQIELVRSLKAHIREHPRKSINVSVPNRDLAIKIPYGYFLYLSHGYVPDSSLWWVRELDVDGKNASSQRYARVMKRAHRAVIDAFDRKDDFDVTVDDGGKTSGYKRVISISDADELGKN